MVSLSIDSLSTTLNIPLYRHPQTATTLSPLMKSCRTRRGCSPSSRIVAKVSTKFKCLSKAVSSPSTRPLTEFFRLITTLTRARRSKHCSRNAIGVPFFPNLRCIAGSSSASRPASPLAAAAVVETRRARGGPAGAAASRGRRTRGRKGSVSTEEHCWMRSSGWAFRNAARSRRLGRLFSTADSDAASAASGSKLGSKGSRHEDGGEVCNSLEFFSGKVAMTLCKIQILIPVPISTRTQIAQCFSAYHQCVGTLRTLRRTLHKTVRITYKHETNGVQERPWSLRPTSRHANWLGERISSHFTNLAKTSQ